MEPVVGPVTDQAELRRTADRPWIWLVASCSPAGCRECRKRGPVTDVDTAVETAVRSLLAEATPGIGFRGEETGGPADGTDWVLDPVDGTVNLTHDLPLCAVALGLVDAGRAVLAAVDLPFLRQRYTASLGGGARRGDHRLRASPATRLRDAVVSVGDYAVGPEAGPKNVARLAVMARLAGRVQRVRMFGSAVLDAAWVADGRLGASVVLGNKPWEGAVGALLAREAGAVVVDLDGRPHTMASTSTVAVAPGLLDELLTLLRS